MCNHSSFTFERMRLMPGFNGKECKVGPRLIKTENGMYLTYDILNLAGVDVFNDLFFVKSVDGGKTFGEPEKLRKIEARENGIRKIFLSSTEYYSRYHKTWFVFGGQACYENENHPIMYQGVAAGCDGDGPLYILRDEKSGHFIGEPMRIPLPFECFSAVPFAQVVEYENGDFLLTYYLRTKDEDGNVSKPMALAVRYRYENEKLSVVASGNLLDYPQANRGLTEPSVVTVGNRHYMTLRTDEQGMLSVSEDGLNYSAPTPWKWDDGSILQNYNTQQRWIQHNDELYLAYTRRGAGNDHVFRHRAPIFMARFDKENLCLIKDSEVALVPELGARLGNFTVTRISENEAWLVTAEWMQPLGCEKYGSDNAFWIAKIRFE